LRKHIKFIVLGLAVAFILWWFGRHLDWSEVRAALRQSDLRLIAAAAAITCATYLVRTYRWRSLLAPLVSARPGDLFAATTVGFSAVFVGGRAAEIVRPLFLSVRDRHVRPSASFVTIALERIYDMTAVIVLFAVNLIWFRGLPVDTATYARVREAGLILLVGAAGGILSLLWFKRCAHEFIPWLRARFARSTFVVRRAGRFVTDLLEQVNGALSVLLDARGLVLTIAYTVLLWAEIAASFWLVQRAFGLQLGPTGVVFVMGWALVGSLVPTPGGAAGTFHAATAGGMILIGVSREQAVAASIVLHLVAFGPALFFGVYYLLRGDVSLTWLRAVGSSKSGYLPAGLEKEPR
jgi:glycosyltransferase 2 family protein